MPYEKGKQRNSEISQGSQRGLSGVLLTFLAAGKIYLTKATEGPMVYFCSQFNGRGG